MNLVPSLLVVALGGSLAWSQATNTASPPSTEGSRRQWSSVSVELPASETSFPPGDGVEITAQCLICHSAGMVLRQPPLTREQWLAEINKMRSAYGAPLPADQVDRLADYLFRINGSPPSNTAAHDAAK